MAGLRFKQDILEAPTYRGGLSRKSVGDGLGNVPIHKLSSNENPLGPAPAVVDIIRRHAATVGEYSDLTDERLRAALAQAHGRDLSPAHFLSGVGGFEVLDMIARGFIEPGENCIVCNPTFGVYARTARRQGARLVDVPLRTEGYTYNVDAILAAVDHQTRIVYVCNPNNPTGSILSLAQMNDLVNHIPDHVLIVADEVYHHYVSRPDFPDSIQYVLEEKNVLIVQSFSKAYGMAGMRVGYAIARPDIADYLARLRRTFHLSTLALEASIMALAHPEHLDRSVALIRREKEWLYDQLARLDVTFWPSEANFILMRCRVPAETLAEQLLDRGLIIRPAAGFGVPDGVRVTIGLPEANQAFIATLASILKAYP